MDTEALKEVLIRQRKKYDEFLIDREKRGELDPDDEFVTIITGVRRCGKSTLLKKEFFDECHYVSFDDERFIEFGVQDFSKLYELLLELFGRKKCFVFDEIQNVKGWERFVRRLNNEKQKVFVTGSNANLLSKEMGTHLTGRSISIELYPFSFKEFLMFNKTSIKVDRITSEEKVILKKHFQQYIEIGGFPEYIKTGKIEYLQSLYNNIVYRDIINRYKIRSERELKEVVYHTISNIGKEISFNNLRKLTGLSNTTTVSDFFHYFENSFLIFLVNKYDKSLKKQLNSQKKAYCIDTALAIQLGFRPTHDKGRLLENIVFLQLKRECKELFFHKRKHECDFLIRKGVRIIEAIQTTWSLDRVNEKRELEGLYEAMNEYKLDEGLILTNDQEEKFDYKGKKIIVKPVWKWLLE